jgi:hypothetical protein
MIEEMRRSSTQWLPEGPRRVSAKRSRKMVCRTTFVDRFRTKRTYSCPNMHLSAGRTSCDAVGSAVLWLAPYGNLGLLFRAVTLHAAIQAEECGRLYDSHTQ